MRGRATAAEGSSRQHEALRREREHAYDKLLVAQVVAAQGRLSDAEPLFLEQVEAARAVSGQQAAEELMTVLSEYASVLCDQAKVKEAQSVLQECMALSQRLHGLHHPLTLNAAMRLAKNSARARTDQKKKSMNTAGSQPSGLHVADRKAHGSAYPT